MATETTRRAVQSAPSKTAAKRHTTATRKGKKKPRALTAKEATLRAWQKTYENRHERLDRSDH